MRLFTKDPKIDALKRVPLFAELPRHELELLARNTDEIDVSTGDVLVREGETGREFFAIADGEVEVDKGHKRLASGDYFGEIALLEETPRTATVRATAPTHLFVLTRQGFDSFVAKLPGVRETALTRLQA